MRSRLLLSVLSVLVVVPVSELRAQGLLLEARHRHVFPLPRPFHPPRPRPRPEPSRSYAIKQMQVQARIRDGVANVQVSQTFENTGSQTMEVSFVFPLPYDGAIDRMTFMVDGKEHEAKLLSAKEARAIYESYMRRNLDPALTEWIGTGVFKTSVFPVPAGASRTVSLRYSQLGRRHDNVGEFLYPLSTARYTSKPIEKVSIEVTLQSQQPIKNVYSPTHSVDVDRVTDELVKVKYNATSQTPAEDFRLFFDYDKKSIGASVISYRPQAKEQGYFMLLASPKLPKKQDKRAPKTVVFAVDRSGSMSGKKMEQAKEALRFVLNNLRKGDTFNIIAYDSEVESFAPELQKFNDESRKSALGFIAGLFAGGSTNIDGALQTAMGQFADTDRPSYLIFLTDGLPTVGEKSTAKISQTAHAANQARVRLFTFGVGYDVNSRLLDKLVRDNHGQAVYVRPNEDIEQHVSLLAKRIETPVLTDIQVRFEIDGHDEEQGPVVNRIYPGNGFDLFAGEQLVIVGRYAAAGAAKVTLTGMMAGEQQEFDYRVKLRKRSKDETNAFVEKLWAVRRVGEIIDEIDLNGQNDELVDELTSLSQKHGIMTPYTSFLAEEETIRPPAIRAGTIRQLNRLHEESGQDAFQQRFAKGRFRDAKRASTSDLSFGIVNETTLEGRGGAMSPESSKKLTYAGNKAFYYREGRWKDAESLEADENTATRVERFSDAYFDLAEKFGSRVTRYLVIRGEVLFELDGVRYLIVDPDPVDERN